MSTKKTIPGFTRTPEIRSKAIEQKSSLKAFNNSTSRAPNEKMKCPTMLNLLSESKLNLTTTGRMVPETVTTDWNLQCQLTSNKYYLALLTDQTTRETIKKYEAMIDIQLFQQAELLNTELCQEQKLEREIRDLKMQIETAKHAAEFNKFYGIILDILQTYNVEHNLDISVNSFEDASNKLYLKNVKPFKSQEDYDKFSQLIDKCNEKMVELKKLIKNIELVDELGEEMRRFVELQKSIIEKQKNISDLKDYVHFLMYKVYSDKFASI